VVKMIVDTDTQYAFTRAGADYMLKNYDGVIKADGGVGNKKQYDARACGKISAPALAQRVVQATQQLGSAGQSGRCGGCPGGGRRKRIRSRSPLSQWSSSTVAFRVM